MADYTLICLSPALVSCKLEVNRLWAYRCLCWPNISLCYWGVLQTRRARCFVLFLFKSKETDLKNNLEWLWCLGSNRSAPNLLHRTGAPPLNLSVAVVGCSLFFWNCLFASSICFFNFALRTSFLSDWSRLRWFDLSPKRSFCITL